MATRNRPTLTRRLLALALLGVALTTTLAGQQVTGLDVHHRAGQTFVTFREVAPEKAPAELTVGRAVELGRKLREERGIAYRVYRSGHPIAALDGLEPLAEVPPLTGWNLEYHGVPSPSSDKPALRYVVEDGGEALPPGTGLFVHNPNEAGSAYYAVTVVVAGRENRSIGPQNTRREPLEETVGQGVPVPQRTTRPETWQYVRGPTLHYYTRWESPPNCSVEGKPIDYVVGIPPKSVDRPGVGLHLHCWGGSLNGGYGWWYGAERGDILIASNQIPYDWWTGYHERYWRSPWERAPRRQELWEGGVVRPYSQTRMLSFLDWVATQWTVDLNRVHVAGNSMGGSGAPMLAIRHADRIAWTTAWVGVHVPSASPQFRSSYAQVYGERDWDVDFASGAPVWDHFSDVWYLRQHAERSVGLVCFSNGKNDGAIGWPQARELHRALQDTRQPHVFVWGQSGHGQRARLPVSLSDRHMPMDLRTDRSLPAFSGCSVDDDPGDGDPASGDAEGQSNLYLFWETTDIVDRPQRWELTVGLIDKAPADEATVNITPRRLQRLDLSPGETVTWTNTPRGENRPVQSGSALVDTNGLVTLPSVRVSKVTNRIVLVR